MIIRTAARYTKNLLPGLLSFVCCLLVMVAKTQQPKLVLPIGHTSFVNNACFSPDGQKIVTASTDQTAKIWDVQSGTLLTDLKGHTAMVNCARFSPNGKKIVTASYDGTAKLWDAATGKLLHDLKVQKPNGSDAIYDACFSPDGKMVVTTAFGDITAKVWDAETGAFLTELKGNTSPVLNVCFSPDSKKIATTFGSMAVIVWDASNGIQLGRFEGDAFWVNSNCFSPDSKKIVTIDERNKNIVDVWNVENRQLLANLKGHTAAVNSICFSPDGKKIVTSSNDSSAKIWDANNGVLLTKLNGHGEMILNAIFSPDGKKIATSSGLNTPKMWDAEYGALLGELKGHTNFVKCICFSPDSKKIVTTSSDMTAKIWDAASGSLLTDLTGHTNWAYSACFSPDGKKIVTACIDGTTKIWDAGNGSLLDQLKRHKKWVYHAFFSADGKKIITSSADSTAKIWDVQNRSLLVDLKGHTGWVWDANFSPDARKVVTASWDSTAKIWDAQNGALLANLRGHTNWLFSACFSPDGKKIVTASFDGTAEIWDAQNGAPLVKLKGHASGVIAARFSPDGKKIVTASWDRTAEIWDAQSGTPLSVLKGHSDILRNACFSPDGNQIATTSEDGTIKLWEAKSGNFIADLKGHTAGVLSAFFSPDGKKIISASFDNTVKLWDIDKRGLLCTSFALDTADYFFQIPSGYYKCSPNAAKLLHYVTSDLKTITFEQLDVKYNRPDLVLEAIGCPDTSLIQSYKRAWQKRITKLGFDTALFTGILRVPEADFQNRSTIQYEQISNRLTLKIKGKDDNTALDRYNVWINEVPLFGVRGISLKSRHTKHFDTTITVTLSNGSNRIETSITNVGGLESYRIPLDVKYTTSQPVKEKLYFIGIGIDHFSDSRYNLNWSVKDIRDLAYNFKKKYGDECIVDTVFDNDVSPEKVSALKQALLKTTENDKVIVAYSGHGLLSKDYDYFLSTYDVDFRRPEKRGLPYETLEDLLDGIPARKKLMLIDACHSGEVDKEEVSKMLQVQAKLDNTKKGVIVFMDTTNNRLGTKNSFELMQEVFVNVGRSTGATIISAAGGTQFALEKGDLKNGVFTYSVLELMKQSPAITVSKLKSYVNQRVTELTNGMQVPTSRNENKVIDWQVW